MCNFSPSTGRQPRLPRPDNHVPSAAGKRRKGIGLMAAMQFSLADPAVNADPFPIFRRLQDEDPVHWSDAVRGWNITRYDDVRAIALDREMSADRVRPFFEVLPNAEQRKLADLRHYLTLWAVFKDAPDHTRLRGLMNRAFTPRAVEALRPNIERIVDDLLDAIVER